MGRMFHRRRVWIRASIVGLLVVIGLGIGIPTVFSGAHVRPVPEVATASQPLGTSSASSVRVLVHVVGAVAHPGMIVMAPGARVIDAVLAAGGLTARADQCGINLARPIADGEQIIVPVTAANTGSCSLSLIHI